MTKLKVGVIGCGRHAQTHFQEIKEDKRLHLAAIAEINSERRETTLQMYKPDESFSDYQGMLQKMDLDIVYVETMPGHLLPIVTACLEEGINTSVEKPPGMNSKETQILANIAKNSNVKTIVSFNRRYFPEVLAVREQIQKSGGAVHVNATYNKPISPLVHSSLKNLVPDLVICDAIHHVDLLRWMAGSSTTTASKAIEVYSIVHDGPREGSHRHNASIKFASGTIGSMISHYGVGYRIQRAEVHAEDLSFYLDLTTNNRLVEHYSQGKAIGGKLNLDSVGGSEYNETRHFVDCILENKTPWSNLDDAVHTMQLCEAIRRGHKGPL